MIYDSIIIGGGASGMMAAITAASKGNQVLLLERMDKLGKKILATGNGRCNLSNTYLDEKCYRGNEPHFPYPLLEQFGPTGLIAFLEEQGILVTEQNGYYYPASLQATTILQGLLATIRSLPIHVITEVCIDRAIKDHDLFHVFAKDQRWQGRTLVLSTGGCAQEKLGSNGSGYILAKGFTHHITDIFPALVGLEGKEKFFPQLAGVRSRCKIRVTSNEQILATEEGEVQFTKYGLSGIPIFQISRYAIDAMRKKKEVAVHLDLVPSMITLEETIDIFITACPYKTASELLQGVMNRKLGDVVLKRLSIPLDLSVTKLDETMVKKMTTMMKDFSVKLTGYKGFDMAQVTAGGVDTNEIVPATLESKILSGLYFTGELMDVDGTCGGYNLQWAFTSGYIVGTQLGAK